MNAFNDPSGDSSRGPSGDPSRSTPDAADADFDLLIQYLDDELTPKGRRDLEQRLETDAAFSHRIGPLVTALAMTIPFDAKAALEVFGTEAFEAEGVFLGALASAPGRGTANATRSLPAVELPITPPMRRPKSEPRLAAPVWEPRGLGIGRFIIWTVGSAVALVLFCVAVFFGTTKSRFIARIVPKSVSMATIVAVATQGGGFLQAGKSAIPGWGPLVQDTTGPGETIDFYGNASNIVRLHPSSRYAFRASKNLVDDLVEAIHGNFGPHATIDGEVEVDLPRGSLEINTRFGTVMLDAGLYVIRAEPFARELLVTVGSGQATVTPFNAKGVTPVVGHVGDFIRLPLAGTIELTRDSTGFPRFTEDPYPHTIRRSPAPVDPPPVALPKRPPHARSPVPSPAASLAASHPPVGRHP